jgi:hypothetical protein
MRFQLCKLTQKVNRIGMMEKTSKKRIAGLIKRYAQKVLRLVKLLGRACTLSAVSAEIAIDGSFIPHSSEILYGREENGSFPFSSVLEMI